MFCALAVAPSAGAWIEIKIVWDIDNDHLVAPSAGAWIEISVKVAIETDTHCRSLRGSVD